MATPNTPHIAIIAKMGAGKTTAADLLVEHMGYEKAAFAGTHPGGLRDIAVRIFGPKAKNDRSILQPLGTLVRDIDEDAWVNPLLAAIDDAGVPIVIDDCRFPNEAWALKGEGFIIIRIVSGTTRRVDRLKATGKWQNEDQLTHVSETALDDWPEDYEIANEGTKADLLDQLVRVIALEQRAEVQGA